MQNRCKNTHYIYIVRQIIVQKTAFFGRIAIFCPYSTLYLPVLMYTDGTLDVLTCQPIHKRKNTFRSGISGDILS